ncbi:hypothetical protein [Haliscomenobacter sp.]|uniref:hypothetical protein n=1 Tax=Haliscomenobacter sp. TaxID=2717303 RepID=UPI003BAA1A83
MKNSLVLFLALVWLLSSCIKDDSGLSLVLPAKTQSGQHTFGFLLNTGVWTNYGRVCFPFAGGCRENLNGRYYPSDGDISITADKVLYKNNAWNTQENIELNLSTNFRGAGTYSTLTNDTIGVAYSFSEIRQPDNTYLLSASNPVFTIVITKIDLLSKTMSGEFSGKLFRRISEASFVTSTTDSIVISEGRFDIRLK